MRLLARRRRHEPAAIAADVPDTAGPTVSDSTRSLVGRYLTDGRSLYRVLHAITDGGPRGPLLELEDCRTLELTLCSRRTLEDMRLRTVA